MRDEDIPELVTTGEAGDILGLTKQGVTYMATVSGRLPGGTAGRMLVFRRDVVEALRLALDEEESAA